MAPPCQAVVTGFIERLLRGVQLHNQPTAQFHKKSGCISIGLENQIAAHDPAIPISELARLAGRQSNMLYAAIHAGQLSRRPSHGGNNTIFVWGFYLTVFTGEHGLTLPQSSDRLH